LRVIATPIILSLGGISRLRCIRQMGDNLGQYKLDNVLDKAVVTQKDMKAEYYHGKTYDIGDFDASFSGISKVAPMAIFSGIFRPAIWDVKNIVMLISSLENTYLIILTIFLLVKLKVFGFFSLIRKNPMLLFCMLFSLFFAFSVGLTVANFGSLVRLRYTRITIFCSWYIYVKNIYMKNKVEKSEILIHPLFIPHLKH
jgi:hypothetical protein